MQLEQGPTSEIVLFLPCHSPIFVGGWFNSYGVFLGSCRFGGFFVIWGFFDGFFCLFLGVCLLVLSLLFLIRTECCQHLMN